MSRLSLTPAEANYGELPWDLRANLGLLNGIDIVHKFGENPDLDASEEIWSAGGNLSYLSSAETMDISSSSTADNEITSTGALTLVVEGLDDDYLEIAETVTLDGTQTVVTANSYLRVNRVYVATSGSGKTNAGLITIAATTAGSTQATISAGHGQTQKAHYTMPANKFGIIPNYAASINGGTGSTEVDVHLETMVFGSNTWRLKTELVLVDTGTSGMEDDFIYGGIYVGPKDEIRAVAIPIGGTNVHVDVDYTLVTVERADGT